MIRHGGGIVQRSPDVVWGFDPCISIIPPCEDYDDEYNNPAPKFSSSPKDVNHNKKTGYVNLFLTEDLTGNFEHFFQCLQYGRWCCNDRELYNLPMLSAQTTPFENNRPCNSCVLLTPSKFKESGDSNQYHNGFQPNTSSTVVATEPGVVTDGGVTCVWENMLVTFFLPNFLVEAKPT